MTRAPPRVNIKGMVDTRLAPEAVELAKIRAQFAPLRARMRDLSAAHQRALAARNERVMQELQDRSVDEIAKRFDMTRQGVHRIIKRRNRAP